MLDQKERIEEAHGLWEIAVTRVAALAEVVAAPHVRFDDVRAAVELLGSAVKIEREAFANWQRVAKECGA